ncbi:MAG: PH domain-containing protein [Propionibacteriaceae bacterium]|nr:PH domain-containing protein [Propionibacteriaceae bacterium]
MNEPNSEPEPGPSFQAPPGWTQHPAPAAPQAPPETGWTSAPPPAGPQFQPAAAWPPPPSGPDPTPPATSGQPMPDPAAAPVEKLTERPHPLTPLIRGWIVLLAVLFGFGREFVPDGSENGGLPPLEFLFGGIGVVALIAGFAGFLSWRFTRFVVDADELRIDTGMLVRTSQRIAFERVQSIDVVQPFAARFFQLAELRIDIGGGESARLRYLSLRRAYELRDYLLARARGHRHAQATAVDLSASSVLTDLHDSDEVLVQVPPATLLLAAVTSHEFFGILLGGVVALVASTYFDLGWASLGLLLPLGSALIGFVAQRVTGQFNYTLSRRPAGLRISRGLTSLTSQSLPPRRVQAVQISQSLIWRWLGFYRIDLAVVGWGALTDDEDGRGVNTIMLPAGTAAQAGTALAALWPAGDYRQVALSPAPKAARWVHPLSAPFLRWGFDDRFFVSQHGWLVRRWQIVPHTRAQSVQLQQGPLSRRLGLADVAVHTAGLQLATRAKGVDAAPLREQFAGLQEHLHRKPEHDVAEPAAPPLPPSQPAQQAVGDEENQPAERRADQADDTISSTE